MNNLSVKKRMSIRFRHLKVRVSGRNEKSEAEDKGFALILGIMVSQP
jgi:hypothetical protein